MRADNFNERQINKSCESAAGRPRFEGHSSLVLYHHKDLCSYPLSILLRRYSIVSRCVYVNHKSASVNSDRRPRSFALLIVRRYESLSRGIMEPVEYCFRVKYHRKRVSEDRPTITTCSRFFVKWGEAPSMINETWIGMVRSHDSIFPALRFLQQHINYLRRSYIFFTSNCSAIVRIWLRKSDEVKNVHRVTSVKTRRKYE